MEIKFFCNSNQRFLVGLEVVMGLGQKILIRVRAGQPFTVWVCISKISPKNVKFFNFFPIGSKNCFGLGRKVPGSAS